MKDPRIEIPSGLRNAGIFGALLMIVLGLWMAWKNADSDITLSPTGNKPKKKKPDEFDEFLSALTDRLKGKKES